MLDYRIETFLKVCDTKNYRKAAESLNMTQPAVTQHIQYLEHLYQAKFFQYKNKKLTLTPKGKQLEEHARSVMYNEQQFRQLMKQKPIQQIRIGATKTIGDYVIFDLFKPFLSNKEYQFTLIIDNTKHLLEKLDNQQLDFLVVEGYFDKGRYDYQLLKEETFTGICSIHHPFANKTITLDQIFQEHLIIREQGSGTRKVFENFLEEHNYGLHHFRKTTMINSLHVIEKMVEENLGISFVYESIPKQNNKLAMFQIKQQQLKHEFNYVFLKHSSAKTMFDTLQQEHQLKD